MAPELQVRCLGRLGLHYRKAPEGATSELPLPATLKAQSLLAYLIVHRDRPHSRDHLAELFWGDRPEHNARRSLATALWQIHRCLPGDDFILADAAGVQFNPHTAFWLDVAEFEKLARMRTPPTHVSALQEAIDLYRGDFLDGFYDDWALSERYRLESLYCDALAGLMAARETLGEHAAALAVAQRLLEQDSMREDAHRAAMRAYCRLNQRHAALSQYARCQQTLQAELGVEPMAETLALRREIAEGRLACETRPEVAAVPAVPQRRELARHPLDVAGQMPLVGREQELACLAETWRAALAGQGSLLLISGEAGVGKTRLAQEFADQQRWQGIRVLQGRCYEFERLLPYQPVAEALRSLPPDVARAAAASVPGWVIAQATRLAPDLVGQEFELPGPDMGSEGEAQERLFEAVSRFLAQLADQAPLLLVLEDLHWATDSTLQLLHYLARSIIAQPLLIVGTLRTEAVPPAHPLATLGRRLERDGLARRLSLSRLSAVAVASLIGQLSGEGEAAAPLADRLYRETEGNPFYLIETVKALFEQGAIRVEAGVWRADYAALGRGRLPLPAGVSETIAARVGRLSDEAQDAVRVAAVAGREFDFDLLKGAWGRGEEATLSALDDLLRHRLIAEAVGIAGADYAFTHHKIQEVVYEGLPRHRRLYLHGRVAQALERAHAGDLDACSAQIAGHYEQAGAAEQAASFYRRAAETARRVYANQDAIAYLSRALALISEADHAGRFTLALARAQLHDVLGQREAQAQDLALLGELAESLDDDSVRTEVALWRARYAAAVSDYATAFTHAQTAVAIALSTQDQAREAMGYLCAGGALWQRGEFEAAQGQLLEARRLAQVAQRLDIEADSVYNMACIASYQGDFDGSRALGQQANGLYDSLGNLPGKMRTLNLLGNADDQQCDCLSAIPYYEHALSLCRQLGDRRFEGILLRNLAGAWQYLGDLAQARGLYERSIQCCRDIGDRRGESETLAWLGELACWRGDDAAARDASEHALHLARSIGAQYETGLALTHLGHALAGLGQLMEAADACRQALEMHRKFNNPSDLRASLAGLADVALAQGQVEDAIIYVEEILTLMDVNTLAQETEWANETMICVRVLHASRDPRAMGILSAAHTALQEQAARISDANLRCAFLENRPDHRDLIAAWRAANNTGLGLPTSGKSATV
jgi:DNA-binding SARP family transcriptional activator/tetratricopeptide (TPR) repeat protein